MSEKVFCFLLDREAKRKAVESVAEDIKMGKIVLEDSGFVSHNVHEEHYGFFILRIFYDEKHDGL